MKILLVGPSTGELNEEYAQKLHDSEHTYIVPEWTPSDWSNIGLLLHFTCTRVDAVHVMPEWRRCNLARAVRAAAVACGKPVLGLR